MDAMQKFQARTAIIVVLDQTIEMLNEATTVMLINIVVINVNIPVMMLRMTLHPDIPIIRMIIVEISIHENSTKENIRRFRRHALD